LQIFRYWICLTFIAYFLSGAELLYLIYEGLGKIVKVEYAVTRVLFVGVFQCSFFYNLAMYFAYDELCSFLNNLVCISKNIREEKLMRGIVLYFSISIFCIAVFLPFASLFHPASHVLLTRLICKGNTSNWPCASRFYNLLLFTMDAVAVQPWIASTSLSVTIIFIFLIRVNSRLKFFKSFCKNKMKPNAKLRYKISMSYRATQLLVNLSNKAYKQFYWPNIEFEGALLVIACFYLGIMLQLLIARIAAFTLSFLVLGFVIVALDIASQPLLLSRSIIHSWKRWRGPGYRWMAKFAKSCRPIGLNVGQFHVIDRKRVPIIIRFCLQRTFFLVMQTRTNH